jgi:hypothetical protein
LASQTHKVTSSYITHPLKCVDAHRSIDIITLHPHAGVSNATCVKTWLEEVCKGAQVSEADALVVDAIKEVYGSFTIGVLFASFKLWDDVNELRDFLGKTFITNVPSPNSTIGHALSLTLALSLMSTYIKAEEEEEVS